MHTHRFVALLALLSLACESNNPCAEGRYDPGPPRACVLADGGRVLLDDAGPVDAAMLDAGAPADTGTCIERVETCDGTDEDCDGSFDETFACARGGTTACTTTCGTTGSGACSATCGLPAAAECTPPVETCNGVDDDCDGVADDGVLEWDTPVEWPGVEQPMSWARIGDRWLVVYERGSDLVGQWIDAEGRLDGPPSPPLLPGTSVRRASVARGSDSDRVLIAYTQLSGTALRVLELSGTTWMPTTPVRDVAPDAVGELHAMRLGVGFGVVYRTAGRLTVSVHGTLGPPSSDWRAVDIDAVDSLSESVVVSGLQAFVAYGRIPAGELDSEIFLVQLTATGIGGGPSRLTTNDTEDEAGDVAMLGSRLAVAWVSAPLSGSLLGQTHVSVVTPSSAPEWPVDWDSDTSMVGESLLLYRPRLAARGASLIAWRLSADTGAPEAIGLSASGSIVDVGMSPGWPLWFAEGGWMATSFSPTEDTTTYRSIPLGCR